MVMSLDDLLREVDLIPTAILSISIMLKAMEARKMSVSAELEVAKYDKYG